MGTSTTGGGSTSSSGSGPVRSCRTGTTTVSGSQSAKLRRRSSRSRARMLPFSATPTSFITVMSVDQTRSPERSPTWCASYSGNRSPCGWTAQPDPGSNRRSTAAA